MPSFSEATMLFVLSSGALGDCEGIREANANVV